ncbi:hypothetical protein ES707_18585 [subsurface metagenome]
MDAGTVLVDELKLEDLAQIPAQVPQVLSHASGTFFIGERKDRHPDQLGDRITEDIGHPLVDKDRDALCVDQADALVEVLDEEPVLVLALPQDILYPPPLRGIDGILETGGRDDRGTG